MAKITLDAPFTLDPKQAVEFKLLSFHADCEARTVHVRVAMLDSNGATIEVRSVVASGPQVQTWVGNQETTILNRLAAQLGVSGTVG